MDNGPPAQSSVSEQQESRQGSNTWVRLGIFLAFGVMFLIVALQFIPAGANVEKAAEIITRMSLQAALAGWGLCWVISGKWLTLKKTMLIALGVYIGLGLWLWHITP